MIESNPEDLMNATLIQVTANQSETAEMQPAIAELSLVELAYVGGGMANVSFE